MGDFTPIIVAIITTAGTIAGIAFGARRLGKLGLGDAQLQVNTSLRQLSETATAERDIWKSKYADEVASHAQTIETLRLTRFDVDECQRQLRNCWDRVTTPSPASQRGRERQDVATQDKRDAEDKR